MTDKEINNKCDGAICPHYRQCVLLQRKEQELKNEKEAARIDLEILNQACLDLRNELEEKEQEYQKLSMKYLDMNSILDDALINLSDVGKPQHTLCELPFEIKKLKQQCEELKKDRKYLYNFLTNKYNYGSFRPMWGAYLLKHFFNENLGDFFDTKAYEMADTIAEKDKEIDRYKQALEKIDNIIISAGYGIEDKAIMAITKPIFKILNEVKGE